MSCTQDESMPQESGDSVTAGVEENMEDEHSTPRDAEDTENVSLAGGIKENAEDESLTPRVEQNTNDESSCIKENVEEESTTLRVGESLQSALECPVCLERMFPPIIMCYSGHNVCRECRPHLSTCPVCRQPLTGTRNVALENLARELFKPEPTRESDPTEPPPAVELDTNQYEDLYGCPLECPWVGRRSEMRVHMLGHHSNKFLDGTDHNNSQWKLPLIVKDVRVIFAFGEVFRYRLRLHTIKKTFYISVQYIGPEGEAPNFKYEVEVTGEQKVIVLVNPTLEDNLDLDAVYESGRCVTLDYDLVKSVGQGKQLVYSIKISRSAS